MRTTFLSRRRLLQLAVIVPFFVAACNDSVAPPKPATIEVKSAVDTEVFLGASLSSYPVVLVRDQNGAPIAGVTVTFTVTTGGGSVANNTTTSGPDGTATAGSWTLGPAPGTNTLVATVAGVGSVVFKVEALVVPVGRFDLATIDGQPLPTTYVYGPIWISGSFTLYSSGTFTESWEWRRSDQGEVLQSERSGKFSSRDRVLFFYSGSTLWADGKIVGDTLTVRVYESDDGFGGGPTYVFVKANLP